MPAKSASSPTFHQRARRDQLVDVATSLLAEHGMAGLSVSAVAREAGVSRGVVAYNVGTLEDLVALVVADVYEAARADLAPAVAAAGSPLEALVTFVGGSVSYYEQHPRGMRALRAVFAQPDQPRAHSADHVRETAEVGDLVRAGQAEGTIAAGDADFMVGALRALLDVAAAAVTAGRPAASVRTEAMAVARRMLRAD